jgi:hypothetical protein
MGADPAAVEKNRRRRLVDRDSGGASARSDVRLIFLQPEHCKRAIDTRACAGSAGDAAAAAQTARGPGPGPAAAPAPAGAALRLIECLNPSHHDARPAGRRCRRDWHDALSGVLGPAASLRRPLRSRPGRTRRRGRPGPGRRRRRRRRTGCQGSEA